MSSDANIALFPAPVPEGMHLCGMSSNESWSASRSRSRSWPLDDSGRMTFLKVPSSIDLRTTFEQRGLYGGPLNIANLPPELQSQILSYLSAVDRVCLAITCKTLTALAASSPHFRANPWTPWLYCSPTLWHHSRYQLIMRLAHGWVDKARLRYCWKCQAILPRDPQYFWRRLELKKRPHWEIKVGVSKDKWRRLSKKRRFEHIIRLWCEAEWEDSSLFSCKDCRLQVFEREIREARHRDLEKGGGGGGLSAKESYARRASLCPVQCPVCMETDLTTRYKVARKKVLRPCVWKWTKWILGGVGNTILVLIYLVYLFFKAPVDLAMWAYRKSKK